MARLGKREPAACLRRPAHTEGHEMTDWLRTSSNSLNRLDGCAFGLHSLV